jgi:hypothetical protein
MGKPADRLDELLEKAFGAASCEPGLGRQDAKPEEIPGALYERVLEAATRRSSEILASMLLEAASDREWTLDDLVEEAGADRANARSFLSKGGDPRRLRSSALARLFWRSGLDPTKALDLLKQAVVSYATYPKLEAGMSWARTAGLSNEQRAQALEAESLMRDPGRAAKEANLYAEDVVSAWTLFKEKSR